MTSGHGIDASTGDEQLDEQPDAWSSEHLVHLAARKRSLQHLVQPDAVLMFLGQVAALGHLQSRKTKLQD